MNLVLDFGNTRAKVGKVEKGVVVAVETFSYDNPKLIADFVNHKKQSQVLLY